jgi:glycerol-3-phosphate acyltransferase PlsY
MSPIAATIAATLAAYLIGSISFAIVVSWCYGLDDPRSYGSGNPGATNVLRTGKRAAAALTLLGDGAKGWFAVFLAQQFAAAFAFDGTTFALVGLAVFLGHLFPVYFRFQGGKGVATALGVLIGFSAWLGLATLATWIVIAVIFRYSSLAALTAALFAPAYAVLLFGVNAQSAAVLAMSAFLFWRHRANIRKLLSGEEARIGKS